MDMLNTVGDLLLSEWLWSMTFAWSYVFVVFLTSWFFLRHMMGFSLFRAGVLSLVLNIVSFVVYSVVVVGLFMHGLQWWYVPQEYQAAGPFLANSYLAGIYFCLHGLFFCGVYRFTGLPISRLLLVALLSNGLAAVISYCYIVIVFKNLL